MKKLSIILCITSSLLSFGGVNAASDYAEAARPLPGTDASTASFNVPIIIQDEAGQLYGSAEPRFVSLNTRMTYNDFLLVILTAMRHEGYTTPASDIKLSSEGFDTVNRATYDEFLRYAKGNPTTTALTVNIRSIGASAKIPTRRPGSERSGHYPE